MLRKPRRFGRSRRQTKPGSDILPPGLHRRGLPPWHPAALIATWFGVGLSPVAPGSCGALAALPIAWAIREVSGRPGLATALVLVCAAGWWAADVFAAARGIRDPPEIVIDEVAGQWLVLLPAPFDPVAWGVGFALFRVFDIWKPWPVRWADRHVAGGLGILLDDLMAGGYAVVVFAAIAAIGGALGVFL